MILLVVALVAAGVVAFWLIDGLYKPYLFREPRPKAKR